jgi:hypothetical protein
MLNRDPKDLIGGLFVAAVGAYVLRSSLGFGIGTAVRMGAGYVPMLLGGAALLLGALIFVSGVASRGTAPRVAWKPFAAVTAGLLTFYLLVDDAGLIPAIMALTGVSSLADEDIRLRERLALVVLTSLGGWLIFAVGLGLPIAGVKGLF